MSYSDPMHARFSYGKRVVAEALGTSLLLMAIVGSGIMGERLFGGNVGLALLANSMATGSVLVACILMFGPISGAHFNPAVTFADAVLGRRPWCEVPGYVGAQVVGAILGVMIAHGMFGEPVLMVSSHVRSGWAHGLSEFMATFGLLSVILVCSDRQPGMVGFAVGAYITGAYWFTASTSFANPAVTLARSATQTFTGIRLGDVPMFIIAQLCGTVAAIALFLWLSRVPSGESAQ